MGMEGGPPTPFKAVLEVVCSGNGSRMVWLVSASTPSTSWPSASGGSMAGLNCMDCSRGRSVRCVCSMMIGVPWLGVPSAGSDNASRFLSNDSLVARCGMPSDCTLAKCNSWSAACGCGHRGSVSTLASDSNELDLLEDGS